MSELLSRQEIYNNIKSVDTDIKPWAQYALFGSWTREDLLETYECAFYDKSINMVELIGFYMLWKQFKYDE